MSSKWAHLALSKFFSFVEKKVFRKAIDTGGVKTKMFYIEESESGCQPIIS
jgi:hypothetical protein